MKKNTSLVPVVLILMTLSPIGLTAAHSEGVPLPGITLYGRITDMAGTSRLTSGILQVQLTPQGGGESITLLTTLTNLGGEFSFVLRVPVEIMVSGETLSDNAVGLPQSSVIYSVSANISSTALTLLGGTTQFAFSPEDHRGSVQRIDMQATGFVSVAEDANGDGEVRRDDLLYWFEHWMDSVPANFDFSGNGKIDGPDLVHLLDAIREADTQ